MALDTKKLQGLFERVYTNKMEENDGRDIHEFAKRVFGDGSVNPDPSLLWQFNTLVVRQADKVAEPIIRDVIEIFATVERGDRTSVIKYEIPQPMRVKVRWSAHGSGVDLVRVEGKRSEVAVPRTFSTGVYYEPFGMIEDPVENTRGLIDSVAEAKVRLYLDNIFKLVEAAVSTEDIPKNNILTGDNLTLKQYNQLAARLARLGGRPVFVADPLLIDHFAMQQTGEGFKELLTDDVRAELLRELNVSRIGRTDAVALVNPFIDDRNSKVEFPVNVGYMLGATRTQKPFFIAEFGGMRQMTEQDIEDERIKIKLVQEADIELIYGNAIGRITENSAVQL